MKGKGLILFFYIVAIYFILKTYYAHGNAGMPNPKTFTAPTYLYGSLALASEFLEGLPIVLAGIFTIALIWQANGNMPKQVTQKSPTTKKVA